MKNWTIAIVAIILALSIVTGGFLYTRLSNEINNAQSEIAALKEGLPLSDGSPQVTPTTPSSSTTMTMVDLISMIQPIIVLAATQNRPGRDT